MKTSFDAIARLKTVGEARTFVAQFQSQLKRSSNNRGARQGRLKTPQVIGLPTFVKKTPFRETKNSLMPRTLNYTKLTNARGSIEWHQIKRELGITIL